MNKNYFDESGNLVNVENKSLAEIYMDGVKQNSWISCNERLPEIDIDVIVFYPYWNDKPIQVAHLAYDELTFELSDGEFNLPTRSVTHWMPLPVPPEGGTKNG